MAIQNNVNVEIAQVADRLVKHFDREPELRARIAQVLLEIDHE